MKRFSAAVLVFLALCSAALAGCGSSGPKTYSKNDTNITVKAGDTFIIRLESNQTTGFQWGVAKPLNTSVIKKVGSKYVVSSNQNQKAGVGGVEQWTFDATGKGNTKIEMIYRQPFEETPKPPAEAVTFDVTVN